MNYRSFCRTFSLLATAGSLWVALAFLPPAATAADPVSEAQTPRELSSVTLRTEGRATPEVRAVLKQLEAAHGNLKTIEAEFDQVRSSEVTGAKTMAHGSLFIQVPDRIRLEFDGTRDAEVPDSSTILFVDDIFYQYIPYFNQVEKVIYSKDEAQEMLKMLMLGFGVSSSDVLKSYDVVFAEKGASKARDSFVGLSFEPLRPEVRKEWKRITVWFDKEKYWPDTIKIEYVSGDIVDLIIKKMIKDSPIKAKVFEPKFGKFGRRKPVVLTRDLSSGG